MAEAVLLAIGSALYAAAPYIIAGAVAAGLSYGISAALAVKPKSPDFASKVDSNRTILRHNAAPARVGYGRNKTSGVLFYAETVDKDGQLVNEAKYLHLGLAMAVGPITDLYNVELNDNQANTVLYSKHFMSIPFMGYQDQPMLRGPVWLDVAVKFPARWLKKYRPLRGIAGLWCIMKADPSVFPSGAPNVRAEWLGRPLYDPRLAVSAGGTQNLADDRTWAYSTNPPLCIADYLTNRRYGRKVPWADICLDCLISAANTCDEDVEAPSQIAPGTPAPTRKRYTCNGNFDASDKGIDVLGRLLTSCSGSAQFYDGQWHIKVGVAAATAVDINTGKPIILTPRTIRDGTDMVILPRPGLKERVNTVRGLFINPAANFQSDAIPPVTHADFVAEDGNQELAEEIELPFTIDIDEARAHATIALKQFRLPLRVIWPGMPMLQQITPWQVVWACLPYAGWGWQGRASVTSGGSTYTGAGIGTGRSVGEVICFEGFVTAANNGQKTITNVSVTGNSINVAQACTTEALTADDVTLADKLFRIADRKQDEKGAIDLTLQEYSDDIYVFELDPAELPPPTHLPDPFLTGPPTLVTVTERTHKNPDGSRVSALVVTWSPPAAGIADSYRVRWRGVDAAGLGATGSSWQERVVRAPTQIVEIIGLPEGSYSVAVASLLNSLVSAEVIVPAVVSYLSAPPPDPINLRVRQNGDGTRTLSWDVGGNGIEPADLAGYEVRYFAGVETDPVATWSSGSWIRRGIMRGRDVTSRTPQRPGLYTFAVRSVDRSHYYSNNVATAQVNVLPTVAGVVTTRAFSEEGWPGTITGGRVTEAGSIEGDGEATWADMTTWATLSTWGSGSREAIEYTSEEIDFGRDMLVDVNRVPTTRRAQSVQIRTSVRHDGDDTASPFRSTARISGRYAKVWCKVTPDPTATTGTVALDELVVTFSEALRTVTESGYDMAAQPLSPALSQLTRTERDATDWLLGPGFRRIGMEALDPPGGSHTGGAQGRQALTVDNDGYFYSTASAGLITIPHHANLNLVAPFTLEFEGRINATSGSALPVLSKSGAWSINWTAGVGLYFAAAAGFTGDDPATGGVVLPVTPREVFHAAWVQEAGRWRGYLNGELVFNLAKTFTLATSANDLLVAKQGASTIDILMKNLRLWTYGRSQQEIRQAMGIRVPVGSAGLVGNWRMQETVATAADYSRKTGDGTRSGSYSQGWILYRESPPIPLDLMPKTFGVQVYWDGDPTGATATRVDVSPDDGATWTNVPRATNTIVPGLTPGASPAAGTTLRFRQFVLATSATARPTITETRCTLAYFREAGDLVVVPRGLSDIEQAAVVSIDQNAVPGLTARLIVQDAAGCRWHIEDPTGVGYDAVVGLSFTGGLVS